MSKANKLVERADEIMAAVSFATPGRVHGWALGVLDRFNNRICEHSGDIGIGYESGYNEMDKALAEEATQLPK
jgi:hypothetical protein